MLFLITYPPTLTEVKEPLLFLGRVTICIVGIFTPPQPCPTWILQMLQLKPEADQPQSRNTKKQNKQQKTTNQANKQKTQAAELLQNLLTLQ